MIIKEESFPSGDLSFLSQLGLRAEELIFFDIETTGLSAHNASLYLIGTVVYEGGSWKLQQLFAESLTDEIEMLEHFFALLSKKKLLLSFNGERFDIPFLEKLLSQYGLSESFQGVESLDLYRELRPAKKLLSLPNYQLKSCERFLGIQREDRFSGGELIYVYLDYLKTKDPKREELLLLHNKEDLKNLPALLPLLSYARLFQHPLPLSSVRLIPSSKELPSPDEGEDTLSESILEGASGAFSESSRSDSFKASKGLRSGNSGIFSSGDFPEDSPYLCLSYRVFPAFPRALFRERERFRILLSGNTLLLYVKLYRGELKYFYPDPKNYYYLPQEDNAVHRSVGEFVDKAFRVKATARTAYQRRRGLFLPELLPLFSPLFQKEYRAAVFYAEFREELFQDPEKADAYLKSFLKTL